MPRNPVDAALGPIARLFALAAGYGVLGLSLLIAVEVLMRRFLNLSLQGGDEFGGYVLAILAAFGFAHTWLERGHTRVEIVLERTKGSLRGALDLVSVLAITIMAVFMAWRAWTTLLESLEYGSLSGTPMMTPLWQPQALWVAGLSFFALVALATAGHAIVLCARRSPLLSQFYGVRTMDEELRAQTEQLGQRRVER